jgi:hypothetical protein
VVPQTSHLFIKKNINLNKQSFDKKINEHSSEVMNEVEATNIHVVLIFFEYWEEKRGKEKLNELGSKENERNGETRQKRTNMPTHLERSTCTSSQAFYNIKHGLKVCLEPICDVFNAHN